MKSCKAIFCLLCVAFTSVYSANTRPVEVQTILHDSSKTKAPPLLRTTRVFITAGIPEILDLQFEHTVSTLAVGLKTGSFWTLIGTTGTDGLVLAPQLYVGSDFGCSRPVWVCISHRIQASAGCIYYFDPKFRYHDHAKAFHGNLQYAITSQIQRSYVRFSIGPGVILGITPTGYPGGFLMPIPVVSVAAGYRLK